MTGDRDEEAEYQQRVGANLMATIALLLLAIASVVTVKALIEQERTRRCIASGRGDCVALDYRAVQARR